MSYRVIKTIRGRHYLYEQRSWREGKRVRTQSRCLGPLDPPLRQMRKGVLGKLRALIEANRASPEERALHAAARFIAQVEREQRALLGEEAAERAAREQIDKSKALQAVCEPRHDQRDAALQLADGDIAGSDPNQIGDGIVKSARGGQQVTGHESGRSLDPARVGANGEPLETGVDGQAECARST